MSIFPTKILLASDGSEEAELAALRAVELAQKTDSELHVVHVGLVPSFLMSDPATRGYNPMLYRTRGYDRRLYEEIEEESRELLRKLSWRVKVAGGDVAGAHLRMGEVDLEIVGLAKKLGADLIVMGCRGIRRAVGGSISDAVIRHATCPVLVVRSREGAEAYPRSSTGEGSGSPRVVTGAPAEEPRPHARGTPRGIRGGPRRYDGLGLDGRPGDRAPAGWLAAQKKSPVAAERDEEARGLWRWLWRAASTQGGWCSWRSRVSIPQ